MTKKKELVSKTPTPTGLEAFGQAIDQLRAATAGKFDDMTEAEVLSFVKTVVQGVRQNRAGQAAGGKAAKPGRQ